MVRAEQKRVLIPSGLKVESSNNRPNFFWILGGIPTPEQTFDFEYYIIPSSDMAKNVSKAHKAWLKAPGMGGRKHNDSPIRTVHLPPGKNFIGWDISKYKNRWSLIKKVLNS